MLHGSYVGKRSFWSESSEIIAPGFLTNVRKYFYDVLSGFDFDGSELISETIDNHKQKQDSCHAYGAFHPTTDTYSYDNLLNDTFTDIYKYLMFKNLVRQRVNFMNG